MDYETLKLTHQITAALSASGFAARGIGIALNARWSRSRAARILPHINDTLLLMSALALAWLLRLNPLAAPWLQVKIVLLLIYIALGMLALRPGRAIWLRVSAWFAALLVFGFIASVALTKSVAGILV